MELNIRELVILVNNLDQRFEDIKNVDEIFKEMQKPEKYRLDTTTFTGKYLEVINCIKWCIDNGTIGVRNHFIERTSRKLNKADIEELEKWLNELNIIYYTYNYEKYKKGLEHYMEQKEKRKW